MVFEQISDRDILALTLYGECRGEPIEGQIAVAQVIRNRVLADLGNDAKPDWWGEGYRGVCLAPKQFSCWNEDDPNRAKLLALAGDLPVVPEILRQAQWVASGVVENWIVSHLNKATHYHATQLPMPNWAKGMQVCAVKGNHVFYKALR